MSHDLTSYASVTRVGRPKTSDGAALTSFLSRFREFKSGHQWNDRQRVFRDFCAFEQADTRQVRVTTPVVTGATPPGLHRRKERRKQDRGAARQKEREGSRRVLPVKVDEAEFIGFPATEAEFVPIYSGESAESAPENIDQERACQVEVAPVNTGATPPCKHRSRTRKSRQQVCPSCQLPTVHLKTHVFNYHIGAPWWELQPLMVCWTCCAPRPKFHVRDHGPYRVGEHIKLFVAGVTRFVEFLKECFSDKDVVSVAVKNQLVRDDSVFTEAEL